MTYPNSTTFTDFRSRRGLFAFSIAIFLFLGLAPFAHSFDRDSKRSLDEVVVTAELIQESVLGLPNSVSVIDDARIEARGAQHLEDLLNLAPNVNFATGASRGRFIQIRGIGERSEFRDPIINSVGVVIDGIDFVENSKTFLKAREFTNSCKDKVNN